MKNKNEVLFLIITYLISIHCLLKKCTKSSIIKSFLLDYKNIKISFAELSSSETYSNYLYMYQNKLNGTLEISSKSRKDRYLAKGLYDETRYKLGYSIY